MGRPSAPDVRCGCSRVPEVSRKDAALGHGHRSAKRHEVSERARRAARRASASSQPGPAVLGQHRPATEVARDGRVAIAVAIPLSSPTLAEPPARWADVHPSLEIRPCRALLMPPSSAITRLRHLGTSPRALEARGDGRETAGRSPFFRLPSRLGARVDQPDRCTATRREARRSTAI